MHKADIVLYDRLVNPVTDLDIGPLEDGDVLDRTVLPLAQFNVRANTPAYFGSAARLLISCGSLAV